MDKEEKIRMEICHIARHQEIDKLNYNDSRFLFLGGITAILALIAIIQNASSADKFFRSKLLVYAILLLTVLFLFFYSARGSKRSNEHFMKREKMIEKRLLNFGIKKDDIDEEFRQTVLKEKEKNIESKNRMLEHALALISLSIAMFALAIQAFVMLEFQPSKLALWLLVAATAISTVILFSQGIWILLSKLAIE